MELGWKHQTNEDYHASPGLSRSPLWTLMRSPLHSRVPVEVTPAMELGIKFHDACENIGKFEETYCIIPADCQRGSGTGQQGRLKDFTAQVAAQGQKIIDKEDLDTIRGMTGAIHGNQDCLDLLEGECETELSGYWEDSETGLLCKLRIDLLNKSKGILVDWKSCVDARPGPFFKSAWDKGYWFQAAWYLWGTSQITGIEHKEFQLGAVEKTPPYGIYVHPVMPDLIELGKTECRLALDHYARCLESDIWPSYEEPSPGFDIPGWKKRQMEFE